MSLVVGDEASKKKKKEEEGEEEEEVRRVILREVATMQANDEQGQIRRKAQNPESWSFFFSFLGWLTDSPLLLP